MFQVFANCPEDMGPGEIGSRAARAEAMGYDGLQVPDAVHDGLLLAAMALNATRHLLVGTGVLLAFPRSPMITAIAGPAWCRSPTETAAAKMFVGISPVTSPWTS